MIVYFYSGYQICNANTIKIQEKKNNKYYEEKYILGAVAAGVAAGNLGGDLIGDAMGKSSKKSDNSPFIENQEKILEGIEEVGENLQNLNKNLIDVNGKIGLIAQDIPVINHKDTERIQEINKIQSSYESNIVEKNKEIIQELTDLNLNNLYNDIIDKIDIDGELDIHDLGNIVNALKTKYLIDRKIIKVEIDGVVFEPLPEFDIDNLDLRDDTNDLFEDDIVIPYINERLGPNSKDFNKRTEKSFFKSKNDESFDYVDKIIIKDDDNETILGSGSQKYLNDEGKKKFAVILDEFNKKNENIQILKNKTKKDFNKGIYLFGYYNYSHQVLTKDEYQRRYESKNGSGLSSELGSN